LDKGKSIMGDSLKKIVKRMLMEELIKEVNPKRDPHHIFQNVIRIGSKIHYGLGAVYEVTKLYPGGFSLVMRNAGKSGGMFQKKFNMEKNNFISQARMGLIKKVT
tara:strand:- start:155 stop:469 length:315 start_codon:yes stop_codon:yes gene_type:complete